MLLNLFRSAGWVRIPLGIFAVLALGIILYKLFALWRLEQLEEEAFGKLIPALQNRDERPLQDPSIAAAPSTQIIHSVSKLRGANETAITYAAEIALSVQRLRLRRYLGTLATIGSTSPFIGLFGTVLGVMQAFQSMGKSGLNEQAIASGIAEALSATALGLLVAIPSVMSYNFLLGRVQGQLLHIHGHIAHLTPLLNASAPVRRPEYEGIPNGAAAAMPRQEV